MIPSPPPDLPARPPASDLVEALPAIVWEADLATALMTYVSAAARDLLGHDPQAWVATPAFWEDHLHPEDRGSAIAAVERAMAEGTSARLQYRFRAADGSYRWFQDGLQIVERAEGRRIVGVMVDITAEHDARARRAGPGTAWLPAHAEGRPDPGDSARPATLVGSFPGTPVHKTIVDNLSDGVYYVDLDRTINYWNRGAERLTGYRAEAMLGQRCYDNKLCHVDQDGNSLCLTGCPLAAAMSDGQTRESIIWLRHADGSRRPVQVRTAPLREGEDGAIVGGVEIFSDATGLVEARSAAETARREALTDPLTGLPNRRLLDATLAARQEDLDARGLPFGLLMVDVDRFKRFNDLHGHEVGDEALKVVATTLRGAVRAGDTVARWGGEEFAIVAARMDEAELAALAERLLRLVRAAGLRVPEGPPLQVRVSIGGSMAVAGEPLSLLFGRADSGLRAAKAEGRDRFVLRGAVAGSA